MHVITGGAYNGKAAWVKEHYQLTNNMQYRWISAYKGQEYPEDLSIFHERLIILEGVEQWLLEMIEQQPSADYREIGKRHIQGWLDWEQQNDDRILIIIGTDISKGIVPIEKTLRIWRDITGWFYQDLVKSCNRLDLIWYGVQKRLK